jgi:hypothetical protein
VGDEVVGFVTAFSAGMCIAWDCLQCQVVCVSPGGEVAGLLLT